MRFAGLLIACGFMTRLPIASERLRLESGALALAAPWLPSTGIIVGIAVAVAAGVGGLISAEIGGLFGLIAWVAMTGALHLDGLGDSADAAGAAHGDPEGCRAVLKDPQAGNFAVVAIGLQLLAKFAGIAALVPNGGVALVGVLVIAAWARFGALVAAFTLPSMGSGLCSTLRQGIDRQVLTVNVAALMLLSVVVAPVLLVAPLIIWLAIALWQRGPVMINGDGLGALIEIFESVLLVALLIGIASGSNWF